MRRQGARCAGLLVGLVAFAAGPARAQNSGPPPAVPPPPGARIMIGPGRPGDMPLFQFDVPAPLPSTEGMSQDQVARLREAMDAHQSGLLDRAHTLMAGLLADLPHHPAVLTVMAQVELDRKEFAAVEKLARRERALARDSLLLATELITSQERQGHARDAVATALEAWIATPNALEIRPHPAAAGGTRFVLPASAWAAQVARLAPADSKGALALMRAAVKRLPERQDLALGLARLEWETGNIDGTLAALAVADHVPGQVSARWTFAGERLSNDAGRDSAAAEEALIALAGDVGRPRAERTNASRWLWSIASARGDEGAVAPRLASALGDIPHSEWDPGVLIGIARGLRETGRTDQARTLLGARTLGSTAANLERALADLRDGPPEKALPELERLSHGSDEGMFRFADALFFAGMPDSALGRYLEVSKEPQSSFAGAALERVYLIEDAEPKGALPAFGRMAYQDWRGERAAAARTADSLYRALPRGPLWAQAAVSLSARREAAGDLKAALEPVLAVAESLENDRLAPVARQRAGDLYLAMKDEPHALAEYEECLARYPRAWNSAEVRRRVEQLRRDRRF